MRGFFSAMARTYLVFGDIEGKLDVLRVECTKCARKGRYHVHKLIEKYGRKANMMKWKEQLLVSDGTLALLLVPFQWALPAFYLASCTLPHHMRRFVSRYSSWLSSFPRSRRYG